MADGVGQLKPHSSEYRVQMRMDKNMEWFEGLLKNNGTHGLYLYKNKLKRFLDIYLNGRLLDKQDADFIFDFDSLMRSRYGVPREETLVPVYV
jgi:hypothetical protein